MHLFKQSVTLQLVNIYWQQHPVTKIGTWGGNGGNPMDIAEAPKSLESITVRSGPGIVAAITFSYVDHAGQKHAAGPWGGSGEQPHTVRSSQSNSSGSLWGIV